ncbi:unnamed protein product [Notodromas monacha]|uniref:TBC1 domain family member 7 n=1 Tax=Notodromas monacha TaxID=399045 RepID=A0A7R9BDV5_9CRUS|nr:unnamed protein product [Notodromas monacha]CAG0913539.1 unnamed protein product [Notodromas monacha]
MTGDVRNIRSHYYRKVGFNIVDEKKTLESLLKESCIDLENLKQYCARFLLTADRRLLVWKIVLGVLPKFASSHDFVAQQRREQYEDLFRSVDVLKAVPRGGHLSRKFVLMWAIETRKWEPETNRWLSEKPAQCMETLSKALLSMFPGNESDCYWLAKSIVSTRILRMEKQLTLMTENFWSVLEREDGELHAHIVGRKAQESVPIESWFLTLFAVVLHHEALLKVWDRVVGGQDKTVVNIAIAVVVHSRAALLSQNNIPMMRENLLKCVTETLLDSEDASIQVVDEAFGIGDHGA